MGDPLPSLSPSLPPLTCVTDPLGVTIFLTACGHSCFLFCPSEDASTSLCLIFLKHVSTFIFFSLPSSFRATHPRILSPGPLICLRAEQRISRDSPLWRGRGCFFFTGLFQECSYCIQGILTQDPLKQYHFNLGRWQSLRTIAPEPRRKPER